MTMLDRMRRHKGWLKWSLAMVVLAFILLYIPSFLQAGRGPATTTSWPSVEGRKITVDRFRRPTSGRCRRTAPAYGGNVDERMLKQLGIDQRIVQQMIEEETGARGSRAARHHRDRRRSRASGSRRCPASRRTASSSASSDTARCCRCRTRR